MAGARILYPQFREEQLESRYPFADNATLTSTTNSSITIASDTFIDAAFFPIGGGRQLYISSITVETQKILITVGDAGNSKRISATYDPINPPEDGIIQFFDTYGRPAGFLLSAPLKLARLSSWAVGAYEFTLAATAFVAAVAIPANEPGVRALQTENNEILTRDIWLVGDQGIVVRQDGERVIRIDIVGVPLFKRFLCAPTGEPFPTTNYIKTINNCGPDAYGNFTFTATNFEVDDSVLRIYPDNGTIVIDSIGRSAI